MVVAVRVWLGWGVCLGGGGSEMGNGSVHNEWMIPKEKAYLLQQVLNLKMEPCQLDCYIF